MFAQFANNLCKKLIERDFFIFSEHSSDLLTEETGLIVLGRVQSPVLYAVNIINSSAVSEEDYNKISVTVSMQLSSVLKSTYCSHLVVLNLLSTSGDSVKERQFTDSKPFFPGDKISYAWWVADISAGQLYFGLEQPTAILDFVEIINASFDGDNTDVSEQLNIKDMELQHRKKTKINLKSSNYYMTLALIIINTIISGVIYFENNQNYIFEYFANNSYMVINMYQYYRLFTSMFLHTSLSHLAFNMLSLYIFGTRLELYLGKPRFILIYFFSGLVGALASAFLTGGISVGASGAIFGLIGAMIVFARNLNKDVGGFNYFTILLFAIMGVGLGFFDINVDNFAHLGGIIGGILLESIFVHIDKIGKVDK